MPRSSPQRLPRILYTDNDRFCRNWLENLVRAGELPDGDVWCWDIERMEVIDASVYDQVHWFCGIGGWPLALKLAGWPAHRKVWTGSCPCQPFSNAGKRKGIDDERHLWPVWLRFISQHRPTTIFGEQVASNLGREWLAGVRLDLEALGYAVGAADLCAAGVGAKGEGRVVRGDSRRWERIVIGVPQIRQRLFWVADAAISGQGTAQSRDGEAQVNGGRAIEAPPYRRFVNGFGNVYRIPEPEVSFLADGIPGTMDRIRAYGNAIVPQVAAAFVRAFLESEEA